MIVRDPTRVRQAPASGEDAPEALAPYAAVAANGYGVALYCDDRDSAIRAARQLLEDGEPLPILQYLACGEGDRMEKALGSYGDIG